MSPVKSAARQLRIWLALLLSAFVLSLVIPNTVFAQDGEATDGDASDEGATDDDADGDLEDEPAPAGSSTSNLDAMSEEEAKELHWTPGWSAGVSGGWLFTSLDELNVPVLQPNNVEEIDASGLLRFRGYGGIYITQKALIDVMFGYFQTVGTETSFDMFYGGIRPALVFPEHRFEFILGLGLGVGSYNLTGEATRPGGGMVSDVGYSGTGLIVEPDLTFRYIATMNLAIDLSVSFTQFVALSDNQENDAIDLDEFSEAGDNPLDWAAPSISLGIVFGEMPRRPPAALDPDADEDLDGIANGEDECPREAEDADGFEDDNGCPDTDNDGDKILDAEDECRDEAEDLDGFEDKDGCPEGDNDKDGVDDAVDKCADQPEDMDGFEDEDGCPDEDNDGDGVPDDKDGCPDAAEDKDGFQDEDGCPDLDNDGDRIGDDKDKCVDKPETWNGVEDDDGCPDKDKATVYVEGNAIKLSGPPQFQAGKVDAYAGNTKRDFEALAGLLKSATWIKRIKIHVHTDEPGTEERRLKLTKDRANHIREVLIENGVKGGRVVTAGDGSAGKSFAGLKGEELRAVREQNRRVDITIEASEKSPFLVPKKGGDTTKPEPKKAPPADGSSGKMKAPAAGDDANEGDKKDDGSSGKMKKP